MLVKQPLICPPSSSSYYSGYWSTSNIQDLVDKITIIDHLNSVQDKTYKSASINHYVLAIREETR